MGVKCHQGILCVCAPDVWCLLWAHPQILSGNYHCSSVLNLTQCTVGVRLWRAHHQWLGVYMPRVPLWVGLIQRKPWRAIRNRPLMIQYEHFLCVSSRTKCTLLRLNHVPCNLEQIRCTTSVIWHNWKPAVNVIGRCRNARVGGNTLMMGTFEVLLGFKENGPSMHYPYLRQWAVLSPLILYNFIRIEVFLALAQDVSVILVLLDPLYNFQMYFFTQYNQL